MFRKVLLASVLSIGAAGTVSAAPIAFSSDGRFQSLSNTLTGGLGCILGNCASISGDGNTLDMSGFNNSTLIADDFTASGLNTNLNDRVIGRLLWDNNVSLLTDQQFNVEYVLTLNFTQPNVDEATQLFALNIQQPPNPTGDTVSGLLISGLPATFNLNGVVVDDFRFSVIGNGSFTNGAWFNPGGDSTLVLTADFTAVPEPTSLALLGAGLLGFSLVKRRRRPMQQP